MLLVKYWMRWLFPVVTYFLPSKHYLNLSSQNTEVRFGQCIKVKLEVRWNNSCIVVTHLLSNKWTTLNYLQWRLTTVTSHGPAAVEVCEWFEQEATLFHHGHEISDECCRRQRVQSRRWTVSGWEAGASEPTGRPGSLLPRRMKVSCIILCIACFASFALMFSVILSKVSAEDTILLGYDIASTGKYWRHFQKTLIPPLQGMSSSLKDNLLGLLRT